MKCRTPCAPARVRARARSRTPATRCRRAAHRGATGSRPDPPRAPSRRRRAAAGAGTGARPDRRAAPRRRGRAASAARGSRRRRHRVASRSRARDASRTRGEAMVRAVRVAVEAHLPGPHLPQPSPGARRRRASGVVQLRGQHRGDAEGEHVAMALGGEGVELRDKGNVVLRPRLVQPLLAERPHAMAGEPRQVGVQDEAECPGHGRSHEGTVCRTARSARLLQHRHQVEASSRACAELEVRCDDGGDELGQVRGATCSGTAGQLRVDHGAVLGLPRPQPRPVVHPSTGHRRQPRAASRPASSAASYSRQWKRLAGCSRGRGRGRRSAGSAWTAPPAAGPRTRGRSSRDVAVGVPDVLDHLQRHHHVRGMARQRQGRHQPLQVCRAWAAVTPLRRAGSRGRVVVQARRPWHPGTPGRERAAP